VAAARAGRCSADVAASAADVAASAADAADPAGGDSLRRKTVSAVLA